MSSYTSPGFNLADSFNTGFNLSSAFVDPDKFKPEVDSNDLWGRVGDYSGLSSQPQGQLRSSAKEDEDTRRQAKILARAFKQNQFQEQGKQGPGYQFVPQQQTGGGGSVYQVDPYTTVYNPTQRQPFTVQGSKSSGPFGSIGQAIGLGGTALGVFGPLGPAVGLVAGQAVDSIV
jgi:hypothetical protein